MRTASDIITRFYLHLWIISKGIRSIVHQHVEARDHDCFEPIEILYYSANNDPICIYCAKEQPYVKEKYRQCNLCADKPAVTKRLAFVHVHSFLDKFLLFI